MNIVNNVAKLKIGDLRKVVSEEINHLIESGVDLWGVDAPDVGVSQQATVKSPTSFTDDDYEAYKQLPSIIRAYVDNPDSLLPGDQDILGNISKYLDPSDVDRLFDAVKAAQLSAEQARNVDDGSVEFQNADLASSNLEDVLSDLFK